MTRQTKKRLGLLAAFTLILLLPVVGTWARLGREKCCAFDGEKILPIYRVRVVDEGGASHVFCGFTCAEKWITAQEQSQQSFLSPMKKVAEKSPLHRRSTFTAR